MNTMIVRSLVLFFCTLFIAQLTAQENGLMQRVEEILQHSKIQAMAVDAENHKYIGTNDGLYRIRAVSARIDTLVRNKSIVAITWHQRAGLWAGLENGKVLHVESGNVVDLENSEAQISSLSIGGNQIWIGTSQGAYTASTTTHKVSNHYTPSNSKLPDLQVNTVYFAPYNIIWIGTDQGVAKIDNDKWSTYEREHKVRAITENKEGVWIASDQNLWLIYQRSRWADADASSGLKRGRIRSLSTDNEGNIYILSDLLIRFNPYNEQIDSVQISQDLLSSENITLGWDDNDQLWLASSGDGLYNVKLYDNTKEALSAVLLKSRIPKCASDSTGILEVQVAGGTPPFNYTWNLSNYVGAELTNLPAGVYSVTVTDAIGRTYELTETIVAPEPLFITVVESNAPSSKGMKNGTATAEVNGGIEPYTISWDNGEKSLEATDLGAGLHVVTVTDDNKCKSTADVIIEEGKIFAELDINKINVGQALRIENLYFQADSSDVEEPSFEILDEIYNFLIRHDQVIIEIGGHTNNIPPDDYCDRLSTARAKSVATYLYQKGIPETRISYKGYGKRVPVATNSTAAGRRKNQRVELRILSLGNEMQKE